MITRNHSIIQDAHLELTY